MLAVEHVAQHFLGGHDLEVTNGIREIWTAQTNQRLLVVVQEIQWNSAEPVVALVHAWSRAGKSWLPFPGSWGVKTDSILVDWAWNSFVCPASRLSRPLS